MNMRTLTDDAINQLIEIAALSLTTLHASDFSMDDLIKEVKYFAGETEPDSHEFEPIKNERIQYLAAQHNLLQCNTYGILKLKPVQDNYLFTNVTRDSL